MDSSGEVQPHIVEEDRPLHNSKRRQVIDKLLRVTLMIITLLIFALSVVIIAIYAQLAERSGLTFSDPDEYSGLARAEIVPPGSLRTREGRARVTDEWYSGEFDDPDASPYSDIGVPSDFFAQPWPGEDGATTGWFYARYPDDRSMFTRGLDTAIATGAIGMVAAFVLFWCLLYQRVWRPKGPRGFHFLNFVLLGMITLVSTIAVGVIVADHTSTATIPSWDDIDPDPLPWLRHAYTIDELDEFRARHSLTNPPMPFQGGYSFDEIQSRTFGAPGNGSYTLEAWTCGFAPLFSPGDGYESSSSSVDSGPWAPYDLYAATCWKTTALRAITIAVFSLSIVASILAVPMRIARNRLAKVAPPAHAISRGVVVELEDQSSSKRDSSDASGVIESGSEGGQAQEQVVPGASGPVATVAPPPFEGSRRSAI